MAQSSAAKEIKASGARCDGPFRFYGDLDLLEFTVKEARAALIEECKRISGGKGEVARRGERIEHIEIYGDGVLGSKIEVKADCGPFNPDPLSLSTAPIGDEVKP